MNPEPYAKGTTVYCPSTQRLCKPSPCPVCLGTTKVLVKAPNIPDEQGHIIGCEYCKWASRDGAPVGHVQKFWQYEPHVRPITIEGVIIEDGPTLQIKYKYNMTLSSWNTVDHSQVEPTYEVALYRASVMCNEACAREAAELVKTPNKTYKIGYANKQIEEAHKAIERWTNFLAQP